MGLLDGSCMSDGCRVVCGTWNWFVLSGAAAGADANSPHKGPGSRDRPAAEEHGEG